jgi:hypothetical protein
VRDRAVTCQPRLVELDAHWHGCAADVEPLDVSNRQPGDLELVAEDGRVIDSSRAKLLEADRTSARTAQDLNEARLLLVERPHGDRPVFEPLGIRAHT